MRVSIMLGYDLESRRKRAPWCVGAARAAMMSEPSWTTNRTIQKTLNSTGTANWFHRDIPTATSRYSSTTWRGTASVQVPVRLPALEARLAVLCQYFLHLSIE